jgi:hypothetical protein
MFCGMTHDSSAWVALSAVTFVAGCGLAIVFARRREKKSDMSLLKNSKQDPSESPVPVIPFDVTRRYDIYCSLVTEQRLYQNVKLTGIRTFDKITHFSSGALGGLLEIEAADGTRMLIPQHGIQMICEHGAQPKYRVLSRWTPPDDGDAWRKESGE